MPKDRLGSISFILSTVELLRALKTVYPYSALSEFTGLAKPVLCRYVKGTNLPSEGTAVALNRSLLEKASLRLLLSRKLRQDSEGYIDSTAVSCDPAILTWAGREILKRYGPKHFNKVLTVATDGIPIASVAALRLDVPLVIAKRNKEVGIPSFIEESYLSSSPVTVTTLYVPRGAISPGERILIVDNIIRTGRSMNALLNLAKKAKASAADIYLLIAAGDEWRKTVAVNRDTRVEIELELPAAPEKKAETLTA